MRSLSRSVSSVLYCFPECLMMELFGQPLFTKRPLSCWYLPVVGAIGAASAAALDWSLSSRWAFWPGLQSSVGLPPVKKWSFFAHLGISLLLFVVGLEARSTSDSEYGTGGPGHGVGAGGHLRPSWAFCWRLLLGFAPLTALYIAVALTFSSTIIVVKLLSDKREIDSLHGRIAPGLFDCAGHGRRAGDDWLSALGGEGNLSLGMTLLQLVLKGGVLLLGIRSL